MNLARKILFEAKNDARISSVFCMLPMTSTSFAQTSPGSGAAGVLPGRAFPLPLSAAAPPGRFLDIRRLEHAE